MGGRCWALSNEAVKRESRKARRRVRRGELMERNCNEGFIGWSNHLVLKILPGQSLSVKPVYKVSG